MPTNQFASLWASSTVPTLQSPACFDWHDWPCPLLTPQTGNRIGLRVCLLTLSGLYRRVLDGQIVWQIGCLDLFIYLCGLSPAYRRQHHFRVFKSSVSLLNALALCRECVRTRSVWNVCKRFAYVSCILAGTWQAPTFHLLLCTRVVPH